MLRLLVTVLTVRLSDAALSSEEQTAISGRPPAPCAEIQGKGYSALARMLSSSPPKTICGCAVARAWSVDGTGMDYVLVPELSGSFEICRHSIGLATGRQRGQHARAYFKPKELQAVGWARCWRLA